MTVLQVFVLKQAPHTDRISPLIGSLLLYGIFELSNYSLFKGLLTWHHKTDHFLVRKRIPKTTIDSKGWIYASAKWFCQMLCEKETGPRCLYSAEMQLHLYRIIGTGIAFSARGRWRKGTSQRELVLREGCLFRQLLKSEDSLSLSPWKRPTFMDHPHWESRVTHFYRADCNIAYQQIAKVLKLHVAVDPQQSGSDRH